MEKCVKVLLRNSNWRKLINYLIAITTCLSLIGLQTAYAEKNSKESSSSALTNHSSSTLSLPLKDIQRFATTIAQIKRYYVEPVSDDKLFNYAIQGMLSNLDPHSDYLDAQALEDLQTVTTGKFGGIGIEMLPDNGFIKVISPLDDTPAYKAGIKPGDMIIKIDNHLVKDMTLRQAINMIRGPAGTKVTLTIARKSEKKPIIVTLTREIVKVQTIKYKMLEGGYGYIRIAFFQNNTFQELKRAVTSLQKQTNGKLKGVIIDLRNDPGGLLDSAVDVANAFLESKNLHGNRLIVYTRGRTPSSDIKAEATGSDILHGIPMIVLINGGSASASEIVAGALQDHKRALIVGERSFGKGSVQTVIPIDYHTAIKLTTALYYTPNGRSIQAEGIEPDIAVADIKIPKADADEGVLNISESDLAKHLANGNGNGNGNKKDTSKADVAAAAQATENAEKEQKSEIKLMEEDFQLYEALSLLKAMHTIQQNSNK